MAQPIGIIYIYALLHSVLTQLPAACASIFRLHYTHNAAAKDDVVGITSKSTSLLYTQAHYAFTTNMPTQTFVYSQHIPL
jgi:hypothetical protein